MKGTAAGGRTLYEKLWDSHIVAGDKNGLALIYVDRHLIQEVSSPQAFAALTATRRTAYRQDANLLVADHAIPTRMRGGNIADPLAKAQVQRLEDNAQAFALPYIPVTDARQGIVHVVGPELGFTLPGSVIVCGDSHTSTHGAFGALAFGIGTSESATVIATQCIWQRRAPTMRIVVSGALPRWVSAKDLALAIIAAIGTAGARGYAVEYAGDTIKHLDMAGRMTLCNMTIEAGARVGLIAPDETTFAYLHGRPGAPTGTMWQKATEHWTGLASDPDAAFEREMHFDASYVVPFVSWGTSPEESLPVTGHIPVPDAAASAETSAHLIDVLDYMGLDAGMAIDAIPIDRVFIGSCTNGRIEDLRIAAEVVRGRRVDERVSAMIVPGSTSTKLQAEAEGLDQVFRDAGFQWRHAGCSMCVAMNDDRLHPGERCASTSNRNFEGRQGIGGRTHLMSPAMAAAASLHGRIVDVREVMQKQ